MFTPDQLKQMESTDIISALSAKLGRELSMTEQLKFSTTHGLSRVGKPMIVYEGQDMATAKCFEETVDYQALADILNK